RVSCVADRVRATGLLALRVGQGSGRVAHHALVDAVERVTALAVAVRQVVVRRSREAVRELREHDRRRTGAPAPQVAAVLRFAVVAGGSIAADAVAGRVVLRGLARRTRRAAAVVEEVGAGLTGRAVGVDGTVGRSGDAARSDTVRIDALAD